MKHTIRDVLHEATRTEPMGSGGEASVYEFPADLPDLKPYLIRERRRFDPNWINASTSLTLPPRIIPGMHISQPLFELAATPKLTIHPRQAGITWRDWIQKSAIELDAQGVHNWENKPCRNIATYTALCDLLLSFESSYGNPFVEAFDETFRMGLMGHDNDATEGNILIDAQAGRLRLIDQLNPIDKWIPERIDRGLWNIECFREFVEREFRACLPLENLDPESRSIFLDRTSRIRIMMEKAQEVVLGMHPFKCKPKPGFEKLYSVEAVGLDQPPHVLVDALRRLEKEAAIPSR